MINRLSGGLIRMLKHSRVAWYTGPDGTTAYYEQPSPGAPGNVFVNGKHVAQLVVDHAGFYADFPNEKVQRLLRERGIDLQGGWSCSIEIYGMEINKALAESNCRAVRHHNEHILVQFADQAIIFVDGVPRWTVQPKDVHRALAEMGLSVWDGWYPVIQQASIQRRTH